MCAFFRLSSSLSLIFNFLHIYFTAETVFLLIFGTFVARTVAGSRFLLHLDGVIGIFTFKPPKYHTLWYFRSSTCSSSAFFPVKQSNLCKKSLRYFKRHQKSESSSLICHSNIDKCCKILLIITQKNALKTKTVFGDKKRRWQKDLHGRKPRKSVCVMLNGTSSMKASFE